MDWRDNITAQVNLYQQLMGLRGQIAAEAQEIYNSWEQDADGIDEVYGSGGICDDISNAISNAVSSIPGVNTTDGGQDGDDHAYVIVYNDTEAYAIDIPHYIYESGGGYSWKKVDGVQFSENVVEIVPLNRNDYDFDEVF